MIVIGMETSSSPCGSGSWLCQVRVGGQTDAFTVDRGQEEEFGCLLLVQDDLEINSPAQSTSPLNVYCLQLYTHVFGCVHADFIILFVKIMHWFSLSRRFCQIVFVSVEKLFIFGLVWPEWSCRHSLFNWICWGQNKRITIREHCKQIEKLK